MKGRNVLINTIIKRSKLWVESKSWVVTVDKRRVENSDSDVQ
jgi:hypothetical protein